jgi:CBS domain-containing protein
MNPTGKSILEMKARDLMSEGVVTIPQQLSIQGAARVLAGSHISGAPVVDARGHCVGVLSSADIVRWAEKSPAAGPGPAARDYCAPWDVQPPEPEGARVGKFMTRDVVTAPPGTPITELARMMLDAHIHRVIVADAEGTPLGVVSTTDILAALAGAGGGVSPTGAVGPNPGERP